MFEIIEKVIVQIINRFCFFSDTVKHLIFIKKAKASK